MHLISARDSFAELWLFVEVTLGPSSKKSPRLLSQIRSCSQQFLGSNLPMIGIWTDFYLFTCSSHNAHCFPSAWPRMGFHFIDLCYQGGEIFPRTPSHSFVWSNKQIDTRHINRREKKKNWIYVHRGLLKMGPQKWLKQAVYILFFNKETIVCEDLTKGLVLEVTD